MPLVNPSDPQSVQDQTLETDVVQGQMNVGFGLWVKYQPFIEMKDLTDRTSQIVTTSNGQIIVQGGQFIYSMEQSVNKFKMLVVSIKIDSTAQTIQHNVFYSFKSSLNTLQFTFDSSIYEGLWVMFYVYYDQLLGKSTFGYYTALESIPSQTVDDVPPFVASIQHKIGGFFQYTNQNGAIIVLNQFTGLMSTIFTTHDENIFSNLASCQNFFEYDSCNPSQYMVSNKNQAMNGDDIIRTNTFQTRDPIYVLKGWIIMEQLSQAEQRTVIFRITINKDYSDDMYIGDREVLLEYFQSSLPLENGLQISTYSYAFPSRGRYKTQEDNKISKFGDQFSELFLKWHYFQYEFGTQNNDGKPMLSLYFPTIEQLQQYKWSQPVKHFTGVVYYVSVGGDDYSQRFMKGYVSDILLETFCQPVEALLVPSCHYTCLTCDGPTQYNCLSCPEDSFRQHQETEKTCFCQQRYVDQDGLYECKSILQAFPQITKQEVELKCSKLGYVNCANDSIECSFGYFQLDQNCVQCPNYFDIFTRTQLTCFDCIIDPKIFAKTLKCTQDAETYNSQVEYTFSVSLRKPNDVSYFELSKDGNDNYLIKLCQGCLGEGSCKEGYFYKDKECQECLEGCQTCITNYRCKQCFPGFYKDDEHLCKKCTNCKTCLLNNGKQWCDTCYGTQELLYGKCVSCGVNCQSCNSDGYCYFCNGSPSLRYISFDGKSCEECNIENCIYCFQYMMNGGIYISNLDLQFNIINFDFMQVSFGCALCKQDYFFNLSTQKCELKPVNDDCDFALILSDATQKCIISSSNIDSVQNIDCPTLLNCKQCIKNYIETDSFCIICEDGYYSGVLTGQCQQCTHTCKTCIQQNKQYRDFWKWQIKAFYRYFLNSNNDHAFENYASTNAEADLELICTSCQVGYILHQNQCIKGCDENCKECVIIDGKSTCIKCYETSSGFLKSLNTQGTCLTCPSNCLACLNRSLDEIADINPYFIVTNSNVQLTRKCYEKSNKINLQENYFHDSFTQTISICTENLQCYNKIIIKQNIYCDFDDLMTKQYESNDEFFASKNIYIQQFFDDSYLISKETASLYQYLNEISVRNVEYQFTFIQGNQPNCVFIDILQIHSTLQQNVFAIQQVDLMLIGQTNPTQLQVPVEFKISNYTTVTFQNIRFNCAQKQDSQNTQSILSLFNLKLTLTLKLINCGFITQNETDKNYSFTFNSNIPYSLYIKNLMISNFYIYDSDIFQFTAQQKILKNAIEIDNVIIKDSYFFNSTLIKYLAQLNHLSLNSVISQIQIKDTKFIQSNFIYSSSLLNYTIGQLDINSITVENTEFQWNSNFLLLSCAEKSVISNIILNNSLLSLGSNFYASNIINTHDIIVNNTSIMNSILITNKVDYTKSEQALLASSDVFLKNFQILNVVYEQQQQILVITKYDEIGGLKFILMEFQLQNCQTVSKTQSQQISYENSMIYIDCQICLLENIQIIRGYGLPEMTIINSEKLEMRNLIISQNSKFLPKALHSSFECVKQFAILNMHFFIYIGQYKDVFIDQVNVQNSLSFNSPFIIFKGYDTLQKILTETIVIQNIKLIQNILIISDTNQHTSLISIESEQKSKVTLSIAYFAFNHLNEYVQDLTIVSATTIQISLQQGSVLMNECKFIQNIVTNSTDAILHIKSSVLQLQNSYFQNNGLMNLSRISNHILFSQSQDQNEIDYASIFQVKSNGGNGLFIIQTLNIDNITINSSYSYYGGGFSITTQAISVIRIANSFFYNTMSSLDDSVYALGGCLYIDASSSQLNFQLHDSIIDTSYSRHDGGAIYITPSLSYNLITIFNLIVRECFSLQNTFFSYTLSKIDTIKSNVIFKNIQFQTSENGFQKYFSLIQDLSEDDASNVAHSNPMIFLQYGNFSIYNCSFLSTVIQFLIKIEQAENIILSNVKVINSTILQSPLFKLNLRTQISGQLQISNLQLTNVIERKQIYTDSCIQSNSAIHSELQCPTHVSQVALNLNEKDQTKQKELQFLCNQLLIYSNKQFNYSLIEIDNFNQTHQLKVEKMELTNIVCENCQFGIFRILEIYQQNKETMKLSQIAIKNCRCGNTGCLSIVKSLDEFILKQNLIGPTRILQQHDYDNLHFKLNQQINIVDSSFLNNTAFYGGSILIVELGTLIKKCTFKNNSAQIGGAIYYSSSESQIFLLETQIIQNTAKVAGGVFLNQQSLQLTKELDIQLLNNNSTMYGEDVIENPRSLTLSIDGGQTLLQKSLVSVTESSITEQIIIKPYKVLGYSQKMTYLTLPSGRPIGTYDFFDQYTSTIIPYNLTLRIIALDKFNKQNKGLQNSYCTIKPFAFNISSQTEEPNVNYNLSFSNVTFNQTSGDYNLDNLVIYFMPNLTNNLVLRLSIQCSSIIIPQYNDEPPFEIKLLVDIRTFNCQLGEYQNMTTGGCTLCDTVQNQYQVQWSAQSCSYKDDQKMKSIESSMIELRFGLLESLLLYLNCGWKPGDQSCIEGHIGALCEQCDLYNIRSQGSYSVSSKYSCGSCDQIAFNIISIILISLWTLISTLMSVSSTVEMIDEFVIGLRLKAFGVTVAIKEASTAILIKVFTNYLQIVSTISTFQLQVPIGLASVVNSVGNPIESMAYSLDCFLVSITEISIIYFRIIWGLIMATMYITIFFGLGGLAVLFKRAKIDFSYVSTSLIYLFIYLQPNIIGGLISLLSYRKISDEYWIQGNVAYRYDTISHAKWVVGFCFPLLIIFCCVLPFFLWFGVHKNKYQLDMTKVRRTWGYLYNEYKLHAYYWETIKILQKQVIIIVLAYYDDHIAIKASLVFLVLFGYSYLTISNKPYMTGQLNLLDTHSIVVCAVSIILASSIYTAQQQNLQEIVWPFYIIIGVLNGLYILKMLLQILFAYFKKLHDKIDIIKDFISKRFPKLANQHPYIKQILESRKTQQIRIKGRYGKIREYIFPQAKKILEFKKFNNFELPCVVDTYKSSGREKEIQEFDYGDIQSLNSPKQSEIITERQNLKTLVKYPTNILNERSSVFSFPRPSGTRIHPEIDLEVESARQSADI
ncbi:unnamed protein product (macronuclear) [Paramecium tetraurelia]|uniref:EGF-like domain-containing protein n=1 Tax=Paramecium tetraurelia TaxID=5888 RepID=A0CQ75_PARTE|nr:uncharacterized protein GSPATT00009290001 [Paramecium tetraurelia]CAK72942.1 unnamed protein product [Paramecium tetraurelia]|eukprot:XP_001440339.1 hypothetical protein (macronuclear) [Paramecium tetraurelia strain d4-2]